MACALRVEELADCLHWFFVKTQNCCLRLQLGGERCARIGGLSNPHPPRPGGGLQQQEIKASQASGRVLASTIVHPDVGLMLGQRRRRWPSIKPTLVQRLLIAGVAFCPSSHFHAELFLLSAMEYIPDKFYFLFVTLSPSSHNGYMVFSTRNYTELPWSHM